jgi:ABC-type Na+ efflux pump permease subunit
MRYANSALRSIKILFAREFLLWWRDKYARKARLIQCLMTGTINGTVFFRASDPLTVIGVLYQSVMFISLGAMLKVPPQIDTRGVFYKEQDANFYPTWTFVLSRSLAGLPSSLQDGLIYGSLIYWLVGLAPTAGCYFVFLLLIMLSAFACGLMFSIFSAMVKDRPQAQAVMSVSIIVMILFSGFTVQPDVIPVYYIWIYWSNLMAWIIRALLVNEYQR